MQRGWQTGFLFRCEYHCDLHCWMHDADAVMKAAKPLLALKRIIKSHIAGFEVNTANKFTGLPGPVLTVHAAVFPFHGERTVVIDPVEGTDDLLEIHIASSGTHEVPVPPPVPEFQVSAKHPGIGRCH